MKKITVVLIVLIVLFLSVKAYLYYQTNISELATKSKRNIDNIKLIKDRMPIDAVISQMGKPDVIDTTTDKLIVYKYTTVDESHPYVYVYFDTLMLACKIINYPAN